MNICRLLPYQVADGPHNMAADEALLESACAGVASLRVYGWSPATLSLGYFQSHHVREPIALPYVRRPSGGMALVHHHELTYALALRAGRPWQDGRSWLTRMHEIIAAALAELGVTVQAHRPPDQHAPGPLCFRHFTSGDLLIGSAKVVGSAQRRQRGAILQHGGILLAQSPFAPELPGIRELSGRSLGFEETAAAIQQAFASDTGWDIVTSRWTADEQSRIEELANEKYARPEWKDRR